MRPSSDQRLFALDLAATGHELSRLARTAEHLGAGAEHVDASALRELAERLQGWACSCAVGTGHPDLVQEITVRHQAHRTWQDLVGRLGG